MFVRLRRGSLRYDGACRAEACAASDTEPACALSGFGAAAFATIELAEPKLAQQAKAGGGGRTRTFEAMRRLIYSQLPLPLGTLPRSTARDPLRPAAPADRPWRGRDR